MKTIKYLMTVIAICVAINASAQYADIGIRIGKFNHGIQLKTLHLNDAGNYSGFECFLYYSNIANGGYGFKPWYIKEWNIHKDGRTSNMFFQVGAGGHYTLYRRGYYKISSNKQGIERYVGSPIYNFGLDGIFGFEWHGDDAPISISFTCNPWWDLVNKGPEWLDFNVSVKYSIPQHSAEEKKQRDH